jgi:hypothetical protein
MSMLFLSSMKFSSVKAGHSMIIEYNNNQNKDVGLFLFHANVELTLRA